MPTIDHSKPLSTPQLLLMATSRFQTLISLPFFVFFISSSSLFISLSYASEDDFHYTNCSRPITCGWPPHEINITYPFWGNGRPGYCGLGGHELRCQDDEYAFIDFGDQSYRVLEIDQATHLMTVARNDLWNDLCLMDLVRNTTMYNSTIFYCNNPDPYLLTLLGGFPCPLEDYPNRRAFFIEDELVGGMTEDHPYLNQCRIITFPIRQSTLDELVQGSPGWREVLGGLFLKLTYRLDSMCLGCESSGGVCGTNLASPQDFGCYCSDKPHSHYCSLPDRNTSKNNLFVKIVIVGVAAGGIVILMPVILYLGRRLRPVLLKGQKGDQKIENFINQHGSLAPKRFSYAQVKRMTNSFGRKLGQGGFGSVYGGKLPDGTLVAVKLLNASKGNGEEFINEVAGISRTSHVNIVALLGFCYEGHRRALIYEFMSNGSLDKFIHDENASRDGTALSWHRLYQIAAGIARGLEYLHRGCSTRILHFDIKPQNILLDDEFRPKISDFGLSKLCLNRESIVSMLVARGTVGYIAPEVFSRNFGGVSHKSDVYSYGMMLLEMVGGRKNNLSDGADRSSEVYFHDQVYQLIEDGYDRGLYGQLAQEDKETARKMAMVGVWCIQTDPKQRPSMGRVIEMLDGSTEALPIPPKPFLFSPPRRLTDSISISVSA